MTILGATIEVWASTRAMTAGPPNLVAVVISTEGRNGRWPLLLATPTLTFPMGVRQPWRLARCPSCGEAMVGGHACEIAQK